MADARPPDRTTPRRQASGTASWPSCWSRCPHPELGEIVIDDALFAVGRNEAPFACLSAGDLPATCRAAMRGMFLEHGGAYIADLGSKNGTTRQRRRHPPEDQPAA